jgi:predicted Zn-dependent protease
MLEEHKAIAKDIIDLAQKYGAEQVSVSLAKSTSFQVDVREQKIESLQESGSSGIHLTVSKNKRRSPWRVRKRSLLHKGKKLLLFERNTLI